MSRADAFDAFHREAHGRLLHQVYAATGTVDGARRAVSDAFVAAAHHWRKVQADHDRESWVRQRALHFAHRDRVAFRGTYGDRATVEGRRLFEGLKSLRPGARHLVVAHLVAGLDLGTAAREVGITDDEARRVIERAESTLVEAGIDLDSRSLTDRLADLRSDLRDVPPDRARRLRREGNRRRRSHLVLAGTAALALAIGAGALTASKPEASAVIESLPGANTPPTPSEPAPKGWEQPDFTSAQLTDPDWVERLDPDARWRVVETSADFGPTKPVHPCLTATPTDPRAKHLWLQELTTARKKQPTRVVETLEVSATPKRAANAYERFARSLATCPSGGYEVTEFAEVTRIGQQATLVRLEHAARKRLALDQIVVARTGRAVVAWLVQAPSRHSVGDRRLETLLHQSVNDICGYADGRCAFTPFDSRSTTPPAAPRSGGFLAAVDLPVMAGLPDPWVATDPKGTPGNPAATLCDRADFRGEGATRVRTRTYVVPTAEKLGDIFGMTQTVGEFRKAQASRAFVHGVERSVATCGDRQLSLEVNESESFKVRNGSADVWQIELVTSDDQAFTFRVAVVRVGATVAQVTFTPTRRFDVPDARYVELARRAAERLTQS